jgi:hypothetical protein
MVLAASLDEVKESAGVKAGVVGVITDFKQVNAAAEAILVFVVLFQLGYFVSVEVLDQFSVILAH